MIEIVACLADVTLVARTKAEIYDHQAFVMPFWGPARGAVLRDTATRKSAAIVASMAFFSRVTVPPRNP